MKLGSLSKAGSSSHTNLGEVSSYSLCVLINGAHTTYSETNVVKSLLASYFRSVEVFAFKWRHELPSKLPVTNKLDVCGPDSCGILVILSLLAKLHSEDT